MRTFLKKQWPLLGVGGLLALGGFFLLTGGRRSLEEPPVNVDLQGDGIRLHGIRYTQDNPGERLRWVLDAREVRFSEDKSSIFFSDFRLRLEPEKGPVIRLKGRKGDYSRNSGDINLWGQLQGTSADGYRILTEHILINERRGYLSTEMPVKILGPFFSVAGEGLFVDMERKFLKILADVTASVKKGSMIL